MTAPRVPEILAPAGDDESLAAALAAGAEAVYFGLDEGLNARARATNFSVARLPELAQRIHRAGARGYVTLNTVVFEHELPFVERIIRAIADAGIDAIIVQDPAVALLARAVAPTLDVHASTQMTISTAEGASFAQRLGIRRVVVPRELSVDEIRRFAQGTSLELEVFIHGALCVSWSGQCLTSEAWGGRSANRGQCAQSCRLPYSLMVDGALKPLDNLAYLLSPLDLSGARAFRELADIGVASLKIEGRLKGPAYVVSAVEGYRRWREAVVGGHDSQPSAQAQLRADLGRMSVAYSRGFSDGFLGGSNHQELVEARFPKHRGALVGEVVAVRGNDVDVRRSARQPTGGAAIGEGYKPSGETAVALPVIGAPTVSALLPIDLPELAAGMGVGFDTGRPQDEEPGGPIFHVEPLPGGWRLRFGKPGPDLSQVRPGHLVWLNSDPTLTRDAKQAVTKGLSGVPGRIPMTLTVRGTVGAPLTLSASVPGLRGGRVEVTRSTSLSLEAARGAGLSAAILEEKLGALGDTPFHLAHFDATGVEPGLHCPVSVLKELRREVVSALEPQLFETARHAVVTAPGAARVVAEAKALQARRPFVAPREPSLIPLVRSDAQLEAVIACGFSEVELDWMEMVGLERAVKRARSAGLKVIIATTRIQKPGEAGFDSRLERLQPDGVLVRHWGALMHFAQQQANASGPVVHGDFSLNVTNSVTAHHVLALGCDTVTTAHDLDEKQLHALLANVPAERMTVVVHHHISTFHTEHCLYAHTLSHGRDYRSCGRPCEKHELALRDREGKEHPVLVDVGCRNTVFNAQAHSAPSAVAALKTLGVRRFRAEFVRESQETTRSVLETWKKILSGSMPANEALRHIGGHEQFGVTAGTMRSME